MICHNNYAVCFLTIYILVRITDITFSCCMYDLGMACANSLRVDREQCYVTQYHLLTKHLHKAMGRQHFVCTISVRNDVCPCCNDWVWMVVHECLCVRGSGRRIPAAHSGWEQSHKNTCAANGASVILSHTANTACHHSSLMAHVQTHVTNTTAVTLSTTKNINSHILIPLMTVIHVTSIWITQMYPFTKVNRMQ